MLCLLETPISKTKSEIYDKAIKLFVEIVTTVAKSEVHAESNTIIIRSVFRTLSNIYDESFAKIYVFFKF